MTKRLEGRVAIVTGAGRGIGREEAISLAAEGAKVVVNDFGGTAGGEGGDTTPAQEVVDAIKSAGGEAAANYGNVSDYGEAEGMVKQAIDTYGKLDILINNAGILRDRMVFNMSEEEWDIVIAVHLKGHFNLTKHACVVMRQQRSGVIVNTSSESGLGNMGQANYSAAKEGIIGLTRTVARDMGRYGVRCNAIRPRAATRLTLSPELQEAWEKSRQQDSAGQGVGADVQAMITNLDPKHVAPLVVWLCTDEAANVNGRNFLVGGNTIGLYSEPELVRSLFTDQEWSVDLLADLMPKSLAAGLRNQWPAKEQEPKPAEA
ncbi:MAG: SDR family NAD(P)-dependent oxidoreductase [Dehalococcoidia bacterium]